MATIEVVVDDLDGTPGKPRWYRTPTGTNCIVDLSDEHARELAEAQAALEAEQAQVASRFMERIARFHAKARKTKVPPKGNGTPQVRGATALEPQGWGAKARAKEERDRIRAWANTHGHDVSPFGSIKPEIVEAYHRAVAAERAASAAKVVRIEDVREKAAPAKATRKAAAAAAKTTPRKQTSSKVAAGQNVTLPFSDKG